MEKPSIRITYDAYQTRDFGVTDFVNIDIFKNAIEKDYTPLIKPNAIGLGGGAYNLIIETFFNLKLKDYLLFVAAYIGKKAVGKIIDPIIERYLFRPFKDAYNALKEKNPYLDCDTIKIDFTDTTLNIISAYPNTIIEVYEDIISKIDEHFTNLVMEDQLPSQITIPMIMAVVHDENISRPPLFYPEIIEGQTKESYFKLWGLFYKFTYRHYTYDLENKQFINCKTFLTTEHFSKFENNPEDFKWYCKYDYEGE